MIHQAIFHSLQEHVASKNVVGAILVHGASQSLLLLWALSPPPLEHFFSNPTISWRISKLSSPVIKSSKITFEFVIFHCFNKAWCKAFSLTTSIIINYLLPGNKRHYWLFWNYRHHSLLLIDKQASTRGLSNQEFPKASLWTELHQ